MGGAGLSGAGQTVRGFSVGNDEDDVGGRQRWGVSGINESLEVRALKIKLRWHGDIASG